MAQRYPQPQAQERSNARVLAATPIASPFRCRREGPTWMQEISYAAVLASRVNPLNALGVGPLAPRKRLDTLP